MIEIKEPPLNKEWAIKQYTCSGQRIIESPARSKLRDYLVPPPVLGDTKAKKIKVPYPRSHSLCLLNLDPLTFL